ncbi:hypothetical protein ABFX02_10G028800 [Erythranthe guttata]|uniref:uncharacterized protein LOC105952798 n=1 Tax=Erythranthe guttata TaxID=4155 RepID=UPI00064E07D1|nr:PREDICTED: uncharacterized protein LOC105952798 [Erythranthe guttata]|eukprot:XP_012831830.1 PREDICTED: uncharacterized protein LOC105952798 [Erythranthe guttata]
MAMSRSCMVLRRAFSTVAPRALRTVPSPEILSAAVSKMDISSYSARHFCTDAKKINLLDQKLIKALKSRISPNDRLAVMEAMPPVPAGFPFAIEDVSYYNSIKLKRELDDGEIIDVEVDLPGSVKYTRTNGDTVPTVLLRVNILKKNGNGLKFNASATFDGIRVTDVTVTEPDPDDSEFPTRFGPYTLEEGSDLQSSLGEFIEKKGVEKKYVEFLYNYLFKNDDRRDVLMVDKMEKFFDE